MKKIFRIMTAVLGLSSLASCVTSLQPLVSYDKVTTDNRLNGTWSQDGETFTIEPLATSRFARDVRDAVGKISEKAFGFTGDSKKDSILFNKLYVVSFEKEGVSYNMIAQLMRLENKLYADLFPAAMLDDKRKTDEADAYNFNSDYAGSFTFAKIEIKGNNALELKFLNGDFIKEQLIAGKIRLKHESHHLFDTFIITASTRELQSFISKYGEDERMYSPQTTVRLTRK